MSSFVASKFRETVSKSKDIRMSSEAEFDVQYPTGFLNFDFINGSKVRVRSDNVNLDYYSIGIADGGMSMFIGRSGCGKTTFTIQIAGNIIRPFQSSAIYHDDIEGGITDTRMQTLLGFDSYDEFKDRYIRRNAGITAENFYERVKMIHDIKIQNRDLLTYDTGLYDPNGNRIYKLEPTIYLLDSLAMLMPGKFTEEEEISGQMSATAAAKSNSAVFKRVIPMCKSANIMLFIINHINDKVDINPMQRKKSMLSYLKQDETLPGGRTVVYLTNLMVRCDDNTKLKEEDAFGINGIYVDFEICKSRNARAGQKTTMVFDYENGFDPELSLFIMLKEHKRVGGAGAYLYLDNLPEVKFSQKQFKRKLAENTELQEAFIKLSLEVLKNNLDDIDEQSETNITSLSNMRNRLISQAICVNDIA